MQHRCSGTWHYISTPATYLHVVEGFHAELAAVLGYDLPLLLLGGLE